MAESPFCRTVPKLQRALDATSLKALQFCPRYYQQTIIEGWRTSGVDLEFGSLLHLGKEVFEKARIAGLPKAEALLTAVTRVLEASGSRAAGLWQPWGGRYETQWRCSATEPYRNSKGNRAKCPWSHKGAWFPEPGPSVCGECGSETESLRRWVPADPVKNRVSLVRTLVWYMDDQPEDGAEGLRPIAFPDGTPAVELPFRLPLPWLTPDGEPYLLVGYLDAIEALGPELFITDTKTTRKALGQGYWQSFSPATQVDLYDLVGSVLFQDLGISGVLIKGVQVMTEGARFGQGIFRKSERVREETMTDLKHWIDLAEVFAAKDYWPMAKANCWLCSFKKVCSAEPSQRPAILAADFEKRHWNPLEDRL